MKRRTRLAIIAAAVIATALALWKIALIKAPPLHCRGELAFICNDLRP